PLFILATSRASGIGRAPFSSRPSPAGPRPVGAGVLLCIYFGISRAAFAAALTVTLVLCSGLQLSQKKDGLELENTLQMSLIFRRSSASVAIIRPPSSKGSFKSRSALLDSTPLMQSLIQVWSAEVFSAKRGLPQF